MPRKKQKSDQATPQEPVSAGAAVAEPEPPAASRLAYIDGPPVDEDGTIAKPDARNWGEPYKAIVTTKDFEMGENRRFKQRVFKFKEKPSDDVIAALKNNGFTYRPAEKAWTIQASAETRVISDQLAKDFSGQSQGASR